MQAVKKTAGTRPHEGKDPDMTKNIAVVAANGKAGQLIVKEAVGLSLIHISEPTRP